MASLTTKLHPRDPFLLHLKPAIQDAMQAGDNNNIRDHGLLQSGKERRMTPSAYSLK